ncbi:WD40-repeat-containing domain protein [Schizophyllum amplum]|uniref:WD40-repeat-containing domain protein n=1 Tax=Schizophyllum amplum TaxID=97359 RepID=A0A550CQC6_9AGAR|nr:WD40-repeat-containing domain protein [Auriculariopsis ampla]
MPDAFFVNNKTRKRKRTASAADPSGKSKKSAKKGREPTSSGGRQQTGKKGKRNDEELDSDRTDDEGNIDDLDLRQSEGEEGSADEDENETPAEKRLRLAKLYLDSIKEGLAEGEFDAADVDRELISARLKQDVLEHSGKVHLFVADSYDLSQPPQETLSTRGHRFSVTSAVASDSAEFLYTAGKEGSIIKWDLRNGAKQKTMFKVRPDVKGKGKADVKGKGKAVPDASIRGHTDEVLALALSSDGKYLASAGKDRRVCVWDAETGEWIKGFIGHLGHKDSISCLAFRKGSHQLYSGSFDRTLKVYDLSPDVMGYVETLFGHQDVVLAIDALRGETCVSAGGRDKTTRFWKIVEETQLVFRGGGRSRIRDVLDGGLRGDDEGEDVDDEMDGGVKRKQRKEKDLKFVEGSLECVAMVDETTFVSGGDSGSICLWSTQKKKPIFTQPLAHGLHETESATEGVVQSPRWVTSLAVLPYSDLFASGSWEGSIRLWQLDPKLKSFSLVGTVPAPGVVNSLQLVPAPKAFLEHTEWASAPSVKKSAPSSVLLVAGLGQEHRFGRWLQVKDGSKNGALVVALHPTRTA